MAVTCDCDEKIQILVSSHSLHAVFINTLVYVYVPLSFYCVQYLDSEFSAIVFCFPFCLNMLLHYLRIFHYSRGVSGVLHIKTLDFHSHFTQAEDRRKVF